MSFPEATEGTDAAWFGVILFVDSSKIKLRTYLEYLTNHSIENRPIVTGNFARQPVVRDLFPDLDPLAFPGAEIIHHTGLFIGLPCSLMSDETIDELVEILLGYKI